MKKDLSKQEIKSLEKELELHCLFRGIKVEKLTDCFIDEYTKSGRGVPELVESIQKTYRQISARPVFRFEMAIYALKTIEMLRETTGIGPASYIADRLYEPKWREKWKSRITDEKIEQATGIPPVEKIAKEAYNKKK